MQPTQFADDYDADFALDALERILPRRCPELASHDLRYSATGGCYNDLCEGRGWLYPDPPDWWGLGAEGVTISDEYQRHLWASRLEAIWRAMGILEEVRV